MNKEQERAFAKSMLDCLLKAGLLDPGEYSKAMEIINGKYIGNKATATLNDVAIEPPKSDVCNEENEEDQEHGKR